MDQVKFFKLCLPQALLGPSLITFSNMQVCNNIASEDFFFGLMATNTLQWNYLIHFVGTS